MLNFAVYLKEKEIMADFHALTVSSIKKLTPSSIAVTLTIPKELAQTFAFSAGQYITVKKEIKGTEMRRAYSISSAPTKKDITIGIKKVDRGGFSDYASTKLQVGDLLDVMPPEGRFTFKSAEVKNIVAFAAGSGITPIMSIAKTVLDSNFAYFTNSQTKEDNALFGRIDTSTVNYALKNKHKDVSFDGYYLCGPETMINMVTDTLVENDVPKDKIYFELFTSTEIKEEMPIIAEGQTKVKVIVDDEEFEITMDKKMLVLDAVLKENIDAPYSCQGGVCSSCIAKVKEGKAEMVKNQILTDGEIADGFILTCQAHPTTATLTVDYDDV
ncbi:MAG: ring-1,2-phenylacetyl-CoA epoxidase subunit PaaE [Maribacter sp.]|jgi:ring-1,2-phenylacetyl-CoA epoxidase subunit PaaE